LAPPQPVIRTVALIGFVGGFLAWLFQMWLGEDPHTSLFLDLVISITLGAGAAIIFVYLVADASHSERTRVYALALLAGFFWQPAWEAGGALIEEKQSSNAANQASDALREAQETLGSLQGADSAQIARVAPMVQEQLLRAQSLTQKIHRTEDLDRVNASAGGFLIALDSAVPSTNPSAPNLRVTKQIASHLYQRTAPNRTMPPITEPGKDPTPTPAPDKGATQVPNPGTALTPTPKPSEGTTPSSKPGTALTPLPGTGKTVMPMLKPAKDIAAVYRDWLGIVPVETPGGVRVHDVAANSAASRVHLRPGDVIVRVGTTPITSLAGLESAWKEQAGAEVVHLTVKNNTGVRELDLHP
jgi:hypothetical protein